MAATTDHISVTPATAVEESREASLARKRDPNQPAKRPTARASIADAWRHRHLLGPMGRSVITATFRATLLGPFWIIFQVLMDTVGKTVIFGNILSVGSTNGLPYFLFLLTGMAIWRVFQRSLWFSLRSFRRFRRVAMDFHFPLLLVPIAATAQGAIEWAIYFLVLAGTIAYFALAKSHMYLHVGPQLALVPVAMLWAMTLAWGMGFFVGSIFQRARDIRFLLRYALPYWMYATPIVYPIDHLHGKWWLIAELNPVAPIIELFDYALYGSGAVPFRWICYALAATIVIFVAGVRFLNRFGARLIGTAGYADDDDLDEEMM